MKKQSWFDRAFYPVGGIICLAMAIYYSPNMVAVMQFLFAAAYCLSQSLPISQRKKNICMAVFFFLFGVWELYSWLVNDAKLYEAVFGLFLVLLSLIIGVVLLINKINKKNLPKIIMIQSKSEEANKILSDFQKQLPNASTEHLQIIGKISERYEPACIVRHRDAVIPFGLGAAYLLTQADGMPIVSLAAYNIGNDLKGLPRGHRGFYYHYDKSVFPQADFHGYQFESQQDREETMRIIADEVKHLFKTADNTYCYCAEIRFEEDKESQFYKNLYDLAFYIENTFPYSPWHYRLVKNLENKLQIYEWKHILKEQAKGKRVNPIQANIAQIMLKDKAQHKEKKRLAMQWIAENGHSIGSADDLIRFYSEWPRGQIDLIIRHLVIQRHPCIEQLCALKKTIEQDLVAAAKRFQDETIAP